MSQALDCLNRITCPQKQTFGRLGNLWAKCFTNAHSSAMTFVGLVKIIASVTRERIAEREAAAHKLPWMQTALAECTFSLRAWRAKKPMLYLHAVSDEDGHLPEDESQA